MPGPHEHGDRVLAPLRGTVPCFLPPALCELLSTVINPLTVVLQDNEHYNYQEDKILVAAFVAFTLFLPVGGYLEHRIGPMATCLLGGFVM